MNPSFGQILKEKRKILGMTQSELAEKMGVSSQTVSRWENGSCMPDISQIVPLSKVLVTSADALLGAEALEDEEIDNVLNELDQMYNPTDYYFNAGKEGAEFVKLSYYRLSALVRKYPTNIRLLRCCAWNGVNYIECALVWQHFQLSDKDLSTIFRDVERMFKTMLNFTDNISEKLNAKDGLAFLYTFMEKYDEAAKIIEDMPDSYRAYTDYCLACKRDDRDARIYHIKQSFDCLFEEMITTFRQMAKSYSIMGVNQRENAIKVFMRYALFMKSMRGTYDDGVYYREMIWIYKYIAIEYIRNGEFESALDAIENVAELCEECYKYVLEVGNTTMDISIYSVKHISESVKKVDYKELKEKLLLQLKECWHECADKENNYIVKSERYKRCVERIRDL